MKFVLGLTGQTGAGKSSLKVVAEKHDYDVVDCDKIAREVTDRKGPALALLCEAFSESILNPDGTLNRAALAEVAFNSRENTEKLNKTVLPFIVREISERIKLSARSKILLDAPTLFESGMNKICNKTVGVIAKKAIRKERIIARDNLTEEAAERRISAGKSDSFFKENCDFVIENNSSIEEFEKNFENIITKF